MIRIGVTPGCPAGIGPEVVARALSEAKLPPATRLFFMASRAQLDEGARRAGVDPEELAHVRCTVDDVDDRGAGVKAGVVDDDALVSQRDALVEACEAAQQGELDGIVTGPVRKKALVVAGVAYPGQTEIVERFLGDGAPPLMVFAGAPFVLGLATVHLALKDVPAAVTPALLERALGRLDEAARGILGKKRVRIAVLGVNPHAGEGGMFGREEIDVVKPALERSQLDVTGPLPADGFFADVARGASSFDAVLAMHHDQGLAPYKLLVRGEGINVTWGCAVPRTSPDHGTADAIAGKHKASSSSMRAAVELCAQLAKRRQAAPRKAR